MLTIFGILLKDFRFYEKKPFWSQGYLDAAPDGEEALLVQGRHVARQQPEPPVKRLSAHAHVT